MPPKKASRAKPGTLLDFLGLDYVYPDDPRLTPGQQQNQREAEAAGALTPERAEAIRAGQGDVPRTPAIPSNPWASTFPDARYFDGSSFVPPGQDRIDVEGWGADGGRAGKSPPFQQDPRYRIDSNPALSPGNDRVDLEGPVAPPLQLDPRYRIDADPALAPGESRIRLDNEPFPGTDSLQLDQSPVAGPPDFPKAGPAFDGRQYTSPAGPQVAAGPPFNGQQYGPPNNPQPALPRELELAMSINGGPMQSLDEAPPAPPQQQLGLDVTGMSINGGPTQPIEGAPPVYAGANTRGRGPAPYSPPTISLEQAPGVPQAPDTFGGPGLAPAPQLGNPLATATFGLNPAPTQSLGGPGPAGGGAPAGSSPGLDGTISYGLDGKPIRNSRQGFDRQAQLAEAGADAGFRGQAAGLQSQWAKDDALVQAGQESVDRLGAAQAQRAKERAAVKVIADEKIARRQQIADDLAGKEPDPSRLWNNMEGWRKAVFGLSMLANALANSRDLKHVNPITQMLTGMVKDDVTSQATSLERKRARAKEGIAEAKEGKAEDLAEVEDSYTQTLTRLNALDRLAAQKAATAGRGSALEAAYQGARVELAKAKQSITAQQTATLATAEGQARAHAHAERMARVEAEATLTKAKVQASVELAKQQADIAKEDRKAKAEAEKDLRYVPSDTGLRLVTGRDEKGNPIVQDPAKARLHKDYVKDAGEVAANANQLDADLTELDKVIQDKDNWDALLKGDGDLNSRITELGRRIATNPAFNKGVTSDSDSRQGATVINGLSNDPNFLSKLRAVPSQMDMMKSAVRGYHDRLPAQINRQLKQYPLPEGGNLEWVPNYNQAPPVKDNLVLPGERETRASQAISVESGTPVDKAATTRLPASDEQIQTAQAVQAQAEGMTAARQMAILTSKLDQQAKGQVDEIEEKGKAALERLDKDAPDYGQQARSIVANMESARQIVQKRANDAKFRYAVVNEKKLDAARAKEDEVVRRLAGVDGSGPFAFTAAHTPRDIPEPSTEEVKGLLSDKGFDVAKLSQADIDAMKKRAVWLAKNPSQPIQVKP